MNIQELILKQENELNEKQVEFLNTHEKILTCGSVIGNTLLDLASNLKKMKDEKLYIEAGFDTFEDYSEQACGLKRRQAYNYIKILDSLGSDFVHSNAQIGVSKLVLLSSLSEEEKQEVVENNDLEEVTVNELKEQIKQLKQDKVTEFEKLKTERDTEVTKLQNKIDKLKADLKSEKEKPVEKVVETIQDPEQQKKIESLELQLKMKQRTIEHKDRKLQELSASVTISNSEELAKFKVLFENVQTEICMMKNLINAIPAEKQDGCRQALKKVGEQLC